jgi:hypothetical protein
VGLRLADASPEQRRTLNETPNRLELRRQVGRSGSIVRGLPDFSDATTIGVLTAVGVVLAAIAGRRRATSTWLERPSAKRPSWPTSACLGLLGKSRGKSLPPTDPPLSSADEKPCAMQGFLVQGRQDSNLQPPVWRQIAALRICRVNVGKAGPCASLGATSGAAYGLQKAVTRRLGATGLLATRDPTGCVAAVLAKERSRWTA